jgi:hypothetical protein
MIASRRKPAGLNAAIDWGMFGRAGMHENPFGPDQQKQYFLMGRRPSWGDYLTV